MTALTGRRALVLGASRGIGAAVAIDLAQRGASITAVARDGEALRHVLADAVGPGDHQLLVADLTAPEGRADLAETVARTPPDVVIAATRVRGRWQRMTRLSAPDVVESMDAHLTHLIELVPAVVPGQRERGFGRWVFISSLVATMGGPGQAEYVMHKAATEALSRTLALEEGRFGITSNVVAPGFVATEATAGAYDARTFEAFGAMNLLGRAGRPEEVAHVVGMLCEPLGGLVTGAVLPVGGGAELNWPMSHAARDPERLLGLVEQPVKGSPT